MTTEQKTAIAIGGGLILLILAGVLLVKIYGGGGTPIIIKGPPSTSYDQVHVVFDEEVYPYDTAKDEYSSSLDWLSSLKVIEVGSGSTKCLSWCDFEFFKDESVYIEILEETTAKKYELTNSEDGTVLGVTIEPSGYAPHNLSCSKCRIAALSCNGQQKLVTSNYPIEIHINDKNVQCAQH